MPHPYRNSLLIVSAAAAAVAALLASCSTVNLSEKTPSPTAAKPATPSSPVPPPAAATATAPAPAPAPAVAPPPARPSASNATTPKAYRQDAAAHLYARNTERIYKGMLQPNLYAVGVLEVDIDRQGNITAINWRRAPSHVPDVMAEIVRTVRAAAPYPVPSRMGKVTYTDIWLWDKSGKFQLDTLTEGQL